MEISIGDAFTIDAPAGRTDYSSGSYRVLEVLTFGHDVPIGWIARVEPLREFSVGGVVGGIAVTGIDCLYFIDGKLSLEAELLGDAEICVPWRVNPLNASNKDVEVALYGNLKWVLGHLSLLDPNYEDPDEPIGGIFRVTTVDGNYSFDFIINGCEEPPVCNDPVILVVDGNVEITCSTPGAVLHYSIDGESPEELYAGPFTVDEPVLIKAVAQAPQFLISGVVEFSWPED